MHHYRRTKIHFIPGYP